MSANDPAPPERALEWAYFELRDRGLIHPSARYGLTVEYVQEVVKTHQEATWILNRLIDMLDAYEVWLREPEDGWEPVEDWDDEVAHRERMDDPDHRYEEAIEWAANHPPRKDDL